jgi:biopolymer transport protein ExbB
MLGHTAAAQQPAPPTAPTAPTNAPASEPAAAPEGTTPANGAATDDGDAEAAKSDAAIPLNPRELMEALGWYFVVPFALASFLAIWFGIERLVVLRRGRVIPRAFVERFLDHLEQGKLDPDTALQLCEENGSPVAHVFAHGVRKWGKPSVEVEQAIIDGGERQVSQLRTHLRMINGISTVSPLIGLLGTVVGMIMSFNQIAGAGAMGRTEQLATGIAMALLTTAVGLMIAIPALILYLYLISRVDSLVMEMDLLAQDVVNLISYEALSKEGGPTRSKTRTRATKKKAV